MRLYTVTTFLFFSWLTFQSGIDSLLGESNKTNLASEKADLFIQLADEYRQVSPDSSLFFALEALEILEEDSIPGLFCRAYNAISTAYSFKGLYDTAIVFRLKAIEHGESEVDKKPLIQAYNGLAIDYYYQNDLDQAAKYFEKSYELSKKTNHRIEEANALQNIGLVKGIQGNVEEEIANYLKARRVFVEEGFWEGVANIDMNLGTAFVPLKKYDSGLYYFENARKIFDSLNHKAALCVIYTNLAQTYFQLGDLNRAEKNALLSASISRKLDLKNEERYIHEVLSKIYRDQEDYKKAYEALLRYQELNDTIFSAEKLAQIEKLKVEFETEQQENEIALLNTENELKDRQISQQNTLITATTISGMLIFLLSIVLYSRYKIKNRLSRQLEEKNTIISSALHEKETLLKEIHHRVKNNLQIIESLLNLQNETRGNKKPEELLKISQDRIHAISTIHEKLYQSENLRQIDFKSYVEDLANHFAESYGDQDVTFEIKLDPLDLDLDQLIPCGLIINELVTNSLKYAFEGKPSGKVWITGKKSGTKYELTIADNGKGFDASARSESIGLRLVNSLVDQLDGCIEKLPGQGTKFVITLNSLTNGSA